MQFCSLSCENKIFTKYIKSDKDMVALSEMPFCTREQELVNDIIKIYTVTVCTCSSRNTSWYVSVTRINSALSFCRTSSASCGLYKTEHKETRRKHTSRSSASCGLYKTEHKETRRKHTSRYRALQLHVYPLLQFITWSARTYTYAVCDKLLTKIREGNAIPVTGHGGP
jgi:hypothetical protein